MSEIVERISAPDAPPFVELPPLPSADLEEALDSRPNLRDISKSYHSRVQDQLAQLHGSGSSGQEVVELYTRYIDR
jgi:hypothetical protein